MVKQKIIPLLMLPIILFTMFGNYITTASATDYQISLSKDTFLSFHDEKARSFFASNSVSGFDDYLIYGYLRATYDTHLQYNLGAFYFTPDTTWTIEEYDDITIYTMSSGKYYYVNGYYYDGITIDSEYSLEDSWGVQSNTSCKIEFDKEGNVIAFKGFNNNYWYQESSYASGYWYDDIFQIEGVTNNNALDLSVSFTPPLEGTVDRLIDQNGVQAESNYFSMTLTNNAPGNAQYMMCIVPAGSSVDLVPDNLVLANLNHLGLDPDTANGIFYFSLQEWIYAPTYSMGGLLDSQPVREISQNTFWHVISGSSSITHNFNWAQINITKDTEYDVVVIGVPTDLSKPSRVFSLESSEYYINLSEAQEVYRSTFVVPNPVTYDPNNTEFGNSANNGFDDAKYDSFNSNAYVDDSGGVIVEENRFGDELEYQDSLDVPSFPSDISDLSLDDVRDLLSQTESFFDFLGVCFSWLPGWFWAILLFGVTALVIIGVVKAIL